MTALSLWDQPVEARKGRQALDRHAEAHRDRLTVLRAFLRQLCASAGRPVSADDARAYLARHPEWDLTPTRNYLGALFRESGWRFVGYVPSETPGSHGRRVGTYVWEGR